MANQAPSISLSSSETKGIKVLLVHLNPETADEYEARSEVDAELSRLSVYSTHTLTDARNLLRANACQLVVYCDGVDGLDFVSIQSELRHADPSALLVPIIQVPTVLQFRESKKLGGILDYWEQHRFQTYDDFKDIVRLFVRENAARSSNRSDLFEHVNALQKCLLTSQVKFSDTKNVSRLVVGMLTPHYDLSPDEAVQIIAAESLYMPWLETAEYSKILSKDKFGLAQLLSETRTWKHAGTPPGSIGGFLITAANYLAHQTQECLNADQIITEFDARPVFLKHPAIRTLSTPLLQKTIAAIQFQHAVTG